MPRWPEIISIPRNYFRFKRLKNLYKYQKNVKYQIIDFYWKQKNQNLSLNLSISFSPFAFQETYQTYLNKKKKILINGNWKDLKYYYHFLKFYKYKVYLLK